QHAVALKLRLVEKLIGGGLVRERRITLLVFQNVAGLVAVNRWFDVEQDAILDIRATINTGITDFAYGPVHTFSLFGGRGLGVNWDAVKFDGHAEVDSDLAHSIA